MRYRLAVFGLLLGFLVAPPVQAEVSFHRPIQGKSVKFVLDEWDKLDDGSFKNSRTNERKTTSGFWDYANGLAMDTAFAAGQAYEHYKMVEAELVERQAKIMNMREAAFRDVLNKPVAGNPSVTYRELFMLPAAAVRTDFVPGEVRVMGPTYMGWLSQDSRVLDIPAAIDDLPHDFARGVIAHQILQHLDLLH